MKVAIAHGSNDLYGASRVLLDDVAVLRAAGHTVDVCIPKGGPLAPLIDQLGAKVHEGNIQVLRRVDGPLAARIPVRLPSALVDADIAVVWTLALAPYLPALRRAGKPTICSVHEILMGKAGNLLARFARTLSNDLMTNSRATELWVLGGRGANGTTVAYPVAPPHRALAMQSSPAGEVRLLLAGRINGHKGHAEAIRASDLARRRGIDVRLTLLGSPFPGQEQHLHEVEALAKGRPWVHVAGQVTDTRHYLGECDILLAPSTVPEPFGLVALEAWAAGRRIIASDGGGLAEATRMVEGHLVKMGCIASLADSIERVANEPELRSPPNAFAEARSRCTRSARASKWDSLIARLV